MGNTNINKNMFEGLYWTLIWFLFAGAFVYLLFCIDPSDNGILGQMRYLIFDTIPGIIKKTGNKIFGPKFSIYLDVVLSYVFRENNCIVQLLYIAVGPGGYCGYVWYGILEHLPNPYIGEASIVFASMWAFWCFTTYYYACVTEPGIITKDTAKAFGKRYERFFDGNLYERKNNCKSCDFDKPARSKHCSVCNHCVARFDHHCIWIKGCVGEKNYKWF